MCSNCENTHVSFEDLHEDPISRPVTIRTREEKRFPCQSCAGTGKYRGFRVHQQEDTCFACGGRGYHKQAPHVRKAANEKRKATRAANLAAAKIEFAKQHPNLIMQLTKISSWHTFANSLVEQFHDRGTLSENQINAAYRSLEKVAQRQQEREAAKQKQQGEVDISKIEEMFAVAQASGLKKLKFRTKHIDISLAPAHGRNAGSLYVIHDGEYAGKITSGKFIPGYQAKENTLELVRQIAEDPAGQARLYGKQTGVCGCCGRELTDPNSIEAGIGPICANKWGL